MLDKIKRILSENKNVSAWKINSNNIESQEFFFIKKSLDMTRSKKVQHIKVTIYKDFEEEGKVYRGASTTEIHPTMSKEEIIAVIEETSFAASLVKNEYYPLVEPHEDVIQWSKSNFAERPLGEWMPLISKSLFEADTYDKGGINSAEIFLNKENRRILNSEGIDVSYSKYAGEIEFITNWKEETDEIELYKNIKFSEFEPQYITNSVKEMLALSKDKASAKGTPQLEKTTVLLSGLPVKEFFSYYYGQAHANAVYNKASMFKVGENIQGDNVEGDNLNINLEPSIINSTKSSPYDDDGFQLNKVELIKNGVLNRYWGNARFSYYLKAEPTGDMRNMVVGCGSKSIDEMRKEPHIELAAFSDFQMDSLTGNFAGEIRLGWYYDGNNRTPITGGSISGSIKDVQKNMFLSKEMQQDDDFVGPKTVQLFNISVAGV